MFVATAFHRAKGRDERPRPVHRSGASAPGMLFFLAAVGGTLDIYEPSPTRGKPRLWKRNRNPATLSGSRRLLHIA